MIQVLLVAFIVTCILEMTIALVMRITEKRVYLLIASVNLLTNPLANLLYGKLETVLGRVAGFEQQGYLVRNFIVWAGYDPVWILIEILVVICEGIIYCQFREWIPEPWKYAVIANVVSAMAGILIG